MRLLLLAGTSEAIQIGHALAREARVVATASVAQSVRPPVSYHIPMRIGGWGGEDEFSTWLEDGEFDAVLDATHPFAVKMSERTALVSERLGIDYVQFLRPAWRPGDADDWTFLNAEEEAADHISASANVLLSTGMRNLDRFDALAENNVWVRVRKKNGAAFPFANGGFLHRPVPLPVPNEMAGLRNLGVDWIVARNSGGGDSAALIEAARRLGVPVGMIRRPQQPEVPRIQTVAEALAWVRRRL